MVTGRKRGAAGAASLVVALLVVVVRLVGRVDWGEVGAH